MDSKTRDLLLSAWDARAQGKDVLKFTEILKFMVERDALNVGSKKEEDKAHVRLSRWLKTLEKSRDIERSMGEKYGWRLVGNPVEFNIFNYLNKLREKYPEIISEESGDQEWKRSSLVGLGFSKLTKPEHEDEKFAFRFLAKRLMDLFEALHLLRNTIVLRTAFQGSGLSVPMYDTVLRETKLALICEDMKKAENLGKIAKKIGVTEAIAPRARSKSEKQVKGDEELVNDILGLENGRTIWTEWFSDIPLKNIQQHIDEYEETVRKHKIRVHNTKSLVSEFRSTWKRVHDYERRIFEKADEEEKPEPLSKKESELRSKLNMLRLALRVRIAQNMEQMNADLDDFAVILTRHIQSTSNWTIEHELYTIWKAVQDTKQGEPPHQAYEIYRQEILKDPLWVLAHIVATSHVATEELEKLKENSWVQIEFGKEYDRFLKYYEEELKRELDELRKPWFSK